MFFLRKIYLFIIIALLLICAGCKERLSPEEVEARRVYSELMNSYRFPYQLFRPDSIYELPEPLREISGLGITSTGEVGCIQDERGLIFIYDTEMREVNRRIGFAKDADYEGVTFVGADAFVLRNNGNIYRVATFDTGKPDKEKYKSLLNRKNNTKGIAYEPGKDRVLVVCQDGYRTGGEFIERMAVFAYDIDSNTVADSVAYHLTLDQVKLYAKLAAPESYKEVFPMFFGNKRTFAAYPSAIAVHPKTGNIYIASGVAHLLFILNPEGKLVHIERLREDTYMQIEGMAFRENGTLLLASEGKEQPGMLYEFLMR